MASEKDWTIENVVDGFWNLFTVKTGAVVGSTCPVVCRCICIILVEYKVEELTFAVGVKVVSG